MRFRNVFIGMGSLLVIIILLLTDPDHHLIQNLPFGAGTISTIIILFTSILYVGFLHLSRKALFDYLDIELDLINKAKLTPEGSGLVVIGLGLFSISIAIVILAATK